jgi:hypothetical protein
LDGTGTETGTCVYTDSNRAATQIQTSQHPKSEESSLQPKLHLNGLGHRDTLCGMLTLKFEEVIGVTAMVELES